MSFDFDEVGRPSTFEGVARGDGADALADAIASAVADAKQPHGTWLRVVSIEVVSVEDPQVGGYRVVLGPTG